MLPRGRLGRLREGDGAVGWTPALRARAIKKLIADDGPLQLSLFDEQDLAEITSDEFPGERLVVRRRSGFLWRGGGGGAGGAGVGGGGGRAGRPWVGAGGLPRGGALPGGGP